MAQSAEESYYFFVTFGESADESLYISPKAPKPLRTPLVSLQKLDI